MLACSLHASCRHNGEKRQLRLLIFSATRCRRACWLPQQVALLGALLKEGLLSGEVRALPAQHLWCRQCGLSVPLPGGRYEQHPLLEVGFHMCSVERLARRSIVGVLHGDSLLEILAATLKSLRLCISSMHDCYDAARHAHRQGAGADGCRGLRCCPPGAASCSAPDQLQVQPTSVPPCCPLLELEGQSLLLLSHCSRRARRAAVSRYCQVPTYCMLKWPRYFDAH